jgi:hypothetical protein
MIQNGKAGMMTNSLIQANKTACVICNRTVSTDCAATKQERRHADLRKDGRTLVGRKIAKLLGTEDNAGYSEARL